MQLIIPTRGRIHQQFTVQSLPRELLKRTTLVCPKREASGLYGLYGDVVDILVQPDATWKIAQKREWIVHEWLKYGHEKILMLDDDLVFFTRKSADDWHLRPIRGEELIPEFQRIEDMLGPEYPHVGLGQRQGNNRLTEVGWKSPAKQVCTLGYYLPVVAKECRWDLVELRSDMCVTLQLLLKGYPNAIWTATVVNQEYDAPGGCNTYRTTEMSDAEAWKLKRLFPGFVSVRKPNYKTSVPRLEVTMQWQKALRDGQRNRSRFFVC
jgi:hypothetical protein